METIRGLNTHMPAIVATGIVFPVMATASVAMRFMSKSLTNAGYGMDDWTVLAALIIYIVAEGLVIRSDLVGRLAATPDAPEMGTYMKLVYIYSIFYFTVIALCETSILLLYKRLFMKRPFQIAVHTLLGITLCWWIATSIIEIGYPSNPIGYYFPGAPDNYKWDLDYLTFWMASGVIELLFEIITIALPLREVLRLHLSGRKQTLLVVVFALSGFVVITGIIRLATLYRPSQSDIDLTLGDVWLNVHLGAAIMSASLPVCKPIISRRGQILSLLSTRRGSASSAAKLRGSLEKNGGNGTLGTQTSKSKLREHEERFGAMFDPRTATTWTEARRAGSNLSGMTEFEHSGVLESGDGIAVTKTVDVRETV